MILRLEEAATGPLTPDQWIAQQIAHARSLDPALTFAPYFDPFTTPVTPVGEFTQTDLSTFAQWNDGVVAQPQIGEMTLNANGPTGGSLAFIWSNIEYELSTGSWYACSRCQPSASDGDTSTARILAGSVNWDFVTYAILQQFQGSYALNLQNATGPLGSGGGVADFLVHDFAVFYNKATDTFSGYRDRQPIPGLPPITSVGSAMPVGTSNQCFPGIAVYGDTSAPMLSTRVAFISNN